MNSIQQRALQREQEKQKTNPVALRAAARQAQTNPVAARVIEREAEKERGFLAALKSGGQSGVSGLILGNEPQPLPKNATWQEKIGHLFGEMGSDLPAMTAGGLAGGELGAIGGAALGPIGATTGAAIGGGAGAFALPTAIKQAFQEYREFAKSGEDLSFGEFLERSGRIAKETGKSAIVGGATGFAGKLVPFIAKIPGGEKLLSTRLGKGAATLGTEIGAMTGAEAAVEQKIPTMEEFMTNLTGLLGFKAAHAAGGAIRRVAGKAVEAKEKATGKKEEVKPEKPLENNQFKTEKGSIYTLNEEGKTTREKAFRQEHGEKEVGQRKESEKTWYVDKEGADKLSIFQTEPYKNKLVELPDGRIGVQPIEGPNKGKILSTSIVKPETSPEKGLYPIESWNKGEEVHFGNKIEEVGQKIPEKPVELSKEERLEQFEDIKSNRPLTAKEQVEFEKLTEKKVETTNEKPIEEVKTEPTEVQKDIQAKELVDKSWTEIISSFVPEALQSKAKEMGKSLYEKIPETGKRAIEKVGRLRQNAKQKMFFEMLENHIGKRNAKMVESQFKWREEVEYAEKGNEKLSKKNLEEMMYYRQKTGNPFKEGDSYEALSERLPKHAKDLVDNVIAKHYEESLKLWNSDPDLKGINPREGLEEIYLPGLYEDNPKAGKIYDEVSKAFKTENPFRNEKTFMSYLEALEKAGLKPRYKNIIELTKAYDNIMNKAMANTKLLKEIREVQKRSNEKFIVQSTDEKNYNLAKKMGFIPFDDIFLRRYVSGTDKEGKPTWATTAAPALVHPDFAAAFQGVFRKDAYKPESPFWKMYDSAANLVKFTNVSLSPFHYGALFEHGVPALGLKAFAIKKWMRQAYEMRKDKEMMKRTAEALLEVHEKPDDVKKGFSLIDKAIDLIPEKMAGVDISKGMNKLKRALNFLFDNFHPNLKLVSWKAYVDAEINKRIKEGKPPTEAEIKRIDKDMAKLINDMYGGQNWETSRYFNNPNTMKWLRRAIAYPDWTVSSIKQFTNVFDKGLKGKAARRFWMKYGLFYATTTSLLKYINSGFENKDPNKSISGVTWNPEKAKKGLLDGDPTKWFMFPLPDFEVKIAGSNFNPGRDRQNKKLYGHFGKQAMELLHYVNKPVDEIFAKSNPLIRMAYKQIMDQTPAGFKARGKYVEGKDVPWDATKPMTIGRVISRATELGSDILPFGIASGVQKGLGPYVASGFGLFPVSKGMSLYSAEPLIEEAIRRKDSVQMNKIRRMLKDNNYPDKQINARFSKVQNRIKKENEKQ